MSTDRTTILPELMHRLKTVFDDAADVLVDTYFSLKDKARVWDETRDLVAKIISDAYDVIPGDIPEGASPRTALLEVAVREMTEKLIEYPSSPYTQNATESLASALQAIKTSMEIDVMNAQDEEPADSPKPCIRCGGMFGVGGHGPGFCPDRREDPKPTTPDLGAIQS